MNLKETVKQAILHLEKYRDDMNGLDSQTVEMLMKEYKEQLEELLSDKGFQDNIISRITDAIDLEVDELKKSYTRDTKRDDVFEEYESDASKVIDDSKDEEDNKKLVSNFVSEIYNNVSEETKLTYKDMEYIIKEALNLSNSTVVRYISKMYERYSF